MSRPERVVEVVGYDTDINSVSWKEDVPYYLRVKFLDTGMVVKCNHFSLKKVKK